MNGWPFGPAMGHITGGGFWHSGREDTCSKCQPPPRVRVIRRSDVARCPITSLAPAHYRDDGTCLCVAEAGELPGDAGT